MAYISAKLAGGINVIAILDVLAACCIGVAAASSPGGGYDTLSIAGDSQASSLVDFDAFPRVEGKRLHAGRYRISGADYMRLAPNLAISDFSPFSQDRLGIVRLCEAGAMPLIRAGQLHAALDAAGRAWPELQVSPLMTDKHLWPELVGIYRAAGGTVAIG